ncbi:rCG50863 [Rattus norvegicus]|uniref:RCG50863 n=1 Tax=Rattus norvegicus TaxID=10116 RepID=A6KIY7_RAT|nr:rCG50863 [Rattus norvegicus]
MGFPNVSWARRQGTHLHPISTGSLGSLALRLWWNPSNATVNQQKGKMRQI